MMKAEEKRRAILASATRVFSEKGFTDATVSEIAKGAGMADSGVYISSKGKEEILFTIPEDQMRIYLSNLDDQIQGIRGAENKLPKLIWYHCKYFTTSRDCTHVLLLECRSNSRFYTSQPYRVSPVCFGGNAIAPGSFARERQSPCCALKRAISCSRLNRPTGSTDTGGNG